VKRNSELRGDPLNRSGRGREGGIAVHFSWDPLENINFARMGDGRIDGRIVVNPQ